MLIRGNHSRNTPAFMEKRRNMIQDIAPHKLKNIYDPAARPSDASLVAHFRGKKLLCALTEEKTLSFPTFAEFRKLAGAEIFAENLHHGISSEEQTGTEAPAQSSRYPFYYLFSLDDTPVFLAAFDGVFGPEEDPENKIAAQFSYRDINCYRTANPREMAYAAVTAFHLFSWYSSNRFCGHCGARTVHDSAERMMRCPACGNMIFPKIMPSVIVAVTNGDRILLTRYNRPGAKLGALVAGFTEIGETVEDTVRREVMEECGLRVKDLVFYKTQPWGISGGGLLVGFWCSVDGDDTIRVDGTELAEGRWVDRDWLNENYADTGIALTGEMISVFAAGGNPRQEDKNQL